MDKITHPLVLFKSQELLPVFKTIDSPNNHWDNYVTNPVDVHIVPGDHETMFQSPNVQILAKQLKDSLNLIQSSN
jgi:thioesterase domain-containing protein